MAPTATHTGPTGHITRALQGEASTRTLNVGGLKVGLVIPVQWASLTHLLGNDLI